MFDMGFEPHITRIIQNYCLLGRLGTYIKFLYDTCSTHTCPPLIEYKSKANNLAHHWLQDSLQLISQLIFPPLIHCPHVYLTKFLGSCVKAGRKLISYFSSLSSSLSSTSSFGLFIAHHNTCSKHPNLTRV